MGRGRVTLYHSLPGDSGLSSQACPQLYPQGLQAMGLSTNPALCPACARKCGGFPRSGRGASCWCGGSQVSGLSFQELPAPSCLASCPSPSWKPGPPSPPYRASVSMVAHQAHTGRALPFTFHTEFGKQLGGKENHTMASNWEVLHYHCESKVSAQGFIFLLSYGLHKLETSRLFRFSRYLEPVPASGGIWTSLNESEPDTQTANTQEVGKIEPDQRGTQLLQFSLSSSVI